MEVYMPEPHGITTYSEGYNVRWREALHYLELLMPHWFLITVSMAYTLLKHNCVTYYDLLGHRLFAFSFNHFLFGPCIAVLVNSIMI